RCAAVAMPLIRCIRFSVRRSAVRMERAAPSTLPNVVPAVTASPSAAVQSTTSPASTAAKTRSATARPARTPSSLTRKTASARRSAGMVARVVTSPAPTSSARARGRRASSAAATSSGRGSTGGGTGKGQRSGSLPGRLERVADGLGGGDGAAARGVYEAEDDAARGQHGVFARPAHAVVDGHAHARHLGEDGLDGQQVVVVRRSVVADRGFDDRHDDSPVFECLVRRAYLAGRLRARLFELVEVVRVVGGPHRVALPVSDAPLVDVGDHGLIGGGREGRIPEDGFLRTDS